MDNTNAVRVECTKLFKQFDKLFESREKEAFHRTYSEILCSSSSTELTLGISLQTIFESTRNALMAAQAVRSETDPGDSTIWNPVTAAVFTFAERLAFLQASPVQNQSSRKTPRGVPSANKPKGKPKPASISAPLSAAAVPPAPAKAVEATAPAPKVVATRAMDLTPHDLGPEEICRIRQQVSAEINSPGNSHPFRSEASVTCKLTNCPFCLTMAKHTCLTRCKYVHIGPSCSSTGWWPHVGRQLWLRVRSSHNRGASYQPKMLDPKPHQLPAISSSYGSFVTASSPNKRRFVAGVMEPEPINHWADDSSDITDNPNSPDYDPNGPKPDEMD